MKIQLSHYEFDLSDRYRAGSVLSADEAKALNVERSDRIRNRVARYLDRKTPMKEVLTGPERAELYDWVAELDSSFEFEARPTVKPKVGTLEAEIKELAQERAETMARERGREADAKLIAELYTALLEDSRVESEAAARIEARMEVTAGGLADL